jgi:hypothetical protein
MFVSTSPACLNYYFRVVRHYKALLDSPHAAVACLWDGFEELWKASAFAALTFISRHFRVALVTP